MIIFVYTDDNKTIYLFYTYRDAWTTVKKMEGVLEVHIRKMMNVADKCTCESLLK